MALLVKFILHLGYLVDPNTELLELQNVQESQGLIEKDT